MVILGGYSIQGFQGKIKMTTFWCVGILVAYGGGAVGGGDDGSLRARTSIYAAVDRWEP